MRNLIQYGAMLAAYGCKLNFASESGEFDIVEFPSRPGAKSKLEAALADIEKFEDTANFTDGLSALALADFVDTEANPLSEQSRKNILNYLGFMRDDRFIAQVLAQAKTNRSWHGSDTPNSCSNFGDICTHRGTVIDPHKRGRKSLRNPDEYHEKNSRGIAREQLITPALEEAYSAIPESNLITVKAQNTVTFDVRDISTMPREQAARLMEILEGLVNVK